MNDRAGQQVGNYRLVQLLGSGGFADVYLGKQVFLDNLAAIKLLHTNLSREDLESFREEARTLVRLIHPNIIRVLDFGLEGNTPFLIMDYAPNGTLRQRHPRGQRLPLTQVVDYVRQVAIALQYAHDEKIIHRDVKPENLLLGRREEILLSDFGIAVVAQSTLTQLTQEMTGTVAYMAPEQIQGHARPASDQYALGIIAYEWLSGSTPFTGSFTELTFKHVTAPVPSLRAKVPGLAPEIERVILTALAKDPTQRFSSVHAFATALEQASKGVKATFSASPQPSLAPTVLAVPVTPILPLLVPDPVQGARHNQAPGLASSYEYAGPQTPADGQNAPPTVPAQPHRYYNPSIPIAPQSEFQQATRPPTPASSESTVISRRRVLISGLSAAALIAVGSGIAWQVVSHANSGNPGSTGAAHTQTPITTRNSTTTSPSSTPGNNATPPAIPQLLDQDTFQRPDQPFWGTASDGTPWGGDAATSHDFSIVQQSGQLHRMLANNSLYTATLGTTPHPDMEILVTATLDSFAQSHIGVMLRYINDNHYYKVILDGTSFHFLKRIDPQHGPDIGSKVSYTPQPSTPYTIRFRVSGTTARTTLQAKFWQANTDEPAGWMITANDSDAGFQSGLGGLRPQINQNVTLNVSSFRLSTLPG